MSLNLNPEVTIDSDSYLNEYNKQHKEQISNNIMDQKEFDFHSSIDITEKITPFNMRASVYASAGGAVAEGNPINYEFLGNIYGNGKNYYRVKSMTWFVNDVSVGGAYVILYDDSDGTFITRWTTSGKGSARMITSNINVTLNQGYMFAQVNKFGFFGVGSLRFIPSYVSDYDTYRFN